PTSPGRIGLPIPAPAAERRAIEQQSPPRGTLSWRQRIRRRVRGRDDGGSSNHERGNQSTSAVFHKLERYPRTRTDASSGIGDLATPVRLKADDTSSCTKGDATPL